MSIRPVDHGVIASSGGAEAFTLYGGHINQYTISSTVWRSHTFRGSGTLEVTGEGSVSAQWLVLGPGGDGQQGGGGAGGVRQYDKSGESGAITLNGGTNYTVTVGISPVRTSNNGNDSSIAGTGLTTITATAGGHGGTGAGSYGGAPADGGSGGGGGTSAASGGSPYHGDGDDGSPLQGRNGGVGNCSVAGGGGGGYGSVGENCDVGGGQRGGDGGTGGTLMSFGEAGAHTTAVYAAGGGGVGGAIDGLGGSGIGGPGNYNSGINPKKAGGVVNTGSGGGCEYGSYLSGGLGSAGIVILRYEIPT